MRNASSRAGRFLIAVGLVSVLAACNARGGQYAALSDYKPDPALKTASNSNLRSRVSHACVVTQARLQKAAEGPLERPCGCYADRTLASLDKGELQSYRTTGYFNDSARAKALSALDSCKLPRPV